MSLTDPGDPRLAGYTALTDRLARQRTESDLGVFVAEGLGALGQLVASDFPVESVLVATNRLARVMPVLQGCPAPLYVAEPSVLAAVAGFDIHRGVVALGRRRPDADPRRLLAAATAARVRAVVVTEAVNDHENLGAIFRNAAAFGAGAVLLDPTTCDPLYRRSIRVSAGHALRVPFARLRPWPAALSDLGSGGWTTVALTPAAGAEPLDRFASAGADRVAIMVGAEGPGLSAGALAVADHRVRIPLAAGVDSLNVATAVAIALHRLAGDATVERFVPEKRR